MRLVAALSFLPLASIRGLLEWRVPRYVICGRQAPARRSRPSSSIGPLAPPPAGSPRRRRPSRSSAAAVALGGSVADPLMALGITLVILKITLVCVANRARRRSGSLADLPPAQQPLRHNAPPFDLACT